MQSIGGTYVPYATVLAAKAGIAVTSVTLVLDAGWGGDQVLTTGYPMNVTVGVGTESATFLPASGSPSPVCPTSPATIQVSKIGPSGSLTIDESLQSVQPDGGTQFRINGCKYQYNISGKSLGVGQYRVDLLINGVPVTQTGPGTIFALK